MRRMRSRSQPEMTVVVYELAIIGGQLPDDASAAFEQVEALHRIVSGMDGTEVGPWEWYVATFDSHGRRRGNSGASGWRSMTSRLKPSMVSQGKTYRARAIGGEHCRDE